jgi:membrane protein YdbS with pleckstrin-like domain
MEDKNYLYDRIKLVWMMPALIIVLLIWTVLFLDAYVFPQLINSSVDLFPYGIVITIAILLLDYAYVEMRYWNHYYEFLENGLRISHGILEKHIDLIPYAKIQHIRAERTIAENLLGLVHIHIEMAGMSHSETQPQIPGVPMGAYEEMIEFIKSRADVDTNNPEMRSVYCPPTASQEELLRLMVEELRMINKRLEEMDGDLKMRPIKRVKPPEPKEPAKGGDIPTHL